MVYGFPAMRAYLDIFSVRFEHHHSHHSYNSIPELDALWGLFFGVAPKSYQPLTLPCVLRDLAWSFFCSCALFLYPADPRFWCQTFLFYMMASATWTSGPWPANVWKGRRWLAMGKCWLKVMFEVKYWAILSHGYSMLFAVHGCSNKVRFGRLNLWSYPMPTFEFHDFLSAENANPLVLPNKTSQAYTAAGEAMVGRCLQLYFCTWVMLSSQYFFLRMVIHLGQWKHSMNLYGLIWALLTWRFVTTNIWSEEVLLTGHSLLRPVAWTPIGEPMKLNLIQSSLCVI